MEQHATINNNYTFHLILVWVAGYLFAVSAILLGPEVFSWIPAEKSLFSFIFAMLFFVVFFMPALVGRRLHSEQGFPAELLKGMLITWLMSLPFLLVASISDIGDHSLAVQKMFQGWLFLGAISLMAFGLVKLLGAFYFPVVGGICAGGPFLEYLWRELHFQPLGTGLAVWTPFGCAAEDFYKYGNSDWWMIYGIYILVGVGSFLISSSTAPQTAVQKT